MNRRHIPALALAAAGAVTITAVATASSVAGGSTSTTTTPPTPAVPSLLASVGLSHGANTHVATRSAAASAVAARSSQANRSSVAKALAALQLAATEQQVATAFHDASLAQAQRQAAQVAASAAPAASTPAASTATSSSGFPNPYGLSPFLACVAWRESNDNPGAVNSSSGAGGLFQFMPSTWANLGQAGLPENAPASVQIAAAEQLYASQGGSPWAGGGYAC